MPVLLRSLRPFNLFLLLLTQVCASYFLGFGNTLRDITDPIHLSIYFSTMLTAAFGYLFNDLMDGKADTINKPDKAFPGDRNSRILAILASLILIISALVSGFAANLTLGLSVLFILSVLCLYSLILKRLPFVGNVTVAFLAALSLLILLPFDPNLKPGIIKIYAIFAFGIHLIREVVKDAEDIQGDELAGYRTLPVMVGLKSTRYTVMVLLFLFILVYTTCVRLILGGYFTEPLSFVYLAYNVLCVGVPLFHMLSRVQYASSKADFTYLSLTARYILVTGILSMLFF